MGFKKSGTFGGVNVGRPGGSSLGKMKPSFGAQATVPAKSSKFDLGETEAIDEEDYNDEDESDSGSEEEEGEAMDWDPDAGAEEMLLYF